MGRASRRIVIGLSTLALALPASEARAGERWELDPATGDWLLVETPEDPRSEAMRAAPRERRNEDHDEERDEERADRDALPAKPRPPVRSGGAIAGGVVLTSVGALFAGVGGFALLYSSATQAKPEEYAAPVAVTALGLGAVAGGITLMVWGGRRDAPTYGLQVAPARIQLGGSF